MISIIIPENVMSFVFFSVCLTQNLFLQTLIIEHLNVFNYKWINSACQLRMSPLKANKVKWLLITPLNVLHQAYNILRCIITFFYNEHISW